MLEFKTTGAKATNRNQTFETKKLYYTRVINHAATAPETTASREAAMRRATYGLEGRCSIH